MQSFQFSGAAFCCLLRDFLIGKLVQWNELFVFYFCAIGGAGNEDNEKLSEEEAN